MIIKRELEDQLLQASKETPVVALVGPRQSGKTTLARHCFPNHAYVNLEDLQMRSLAAQDPKRFLKDFPSKEGIILDEVQHLPELFSYIQVIADEMKKDGYFVLTGSQNFKVHKGISQSLAGRVSELTLLPLSIQELSQAGLLPSKIEDLVFKGSYPKLYAREDVSIERLYKNYINTYIGKDIREISKISNTITFVKFIKMVATRSGQVLNIKSISDDLGIAHSTATKWISLLKATYIIFLLQPYNRKIPKQIVKSPKLFFFDTGLACALLGIHSAEELSHSYLRSPLIETCIVSDLYKQFCNLDKSPKTLQYWRDYQDREVDAVINKQPHPIAIEVKAGKTVSPNYFKHLLYWNEITKTTSETNYLIYGGEDSHRWPSASVLSWKSAGDLIKKVI